jgi:hypothetical protein
MPWITFYLSGLVRPEIHFGRKAYSAFHLCGYTGLLLAVLLAMVLVVYQQLSLWVMVGIITVAVATFLAMAMTTKIILGEERLIYYHHEIAIMIVAALVLWQFDQPVLPYLDITILGIGTFLVCGRIGCFMVGCCHGRPHQFGVCYREEHAQAGFTAYYVGIRLFPIQAVESLWVLGTVAVGAAIILQHYSPGIALAWYIISYDIGRFFFEFMRGDPSRHYSWGFSEGQWTSVVLMIVLVWLELSGFVPYELWHSAATAGLILVMVTIVLIRRFRKTTKYRLLNPRHVREIARAVQMVSRTEGILTAVNNGGPMFPDIAVRSTSQGICISGGMLAEGSSCLRHYALSCQRGAMTADIAEIVSRVILTTSRHSYDSKELIKGKDGVYHLLLHDSMAE